MAISSAAADLASLNNEEFGRGVSNGDLTSLLAQAQQGPDLGAGIEDARAASTQTEESFNRGLGRYGATLTQEQFLAREKHRKLNLAATSAGIAEGTRSQAKEFRLQSYADLANVRKELIGQSRSNLSGAAGLANDRDQAYKIAKANSLESKKQAALTVAAIGAGLFLSSREYKDGIKAYDPSMALDTVEDLDLVQFTYKEGIDALPGTHIGLIAEDAPDIIATEDHKALNTYNMIGILLGAVQELSTQVRDLKGAK